MTNEQAILTVEAEIDKLKQSYSDHLAILTKKIHEHNEEPSLQDLIECQRMGTQLFNFIENFVGNSGLLGAHANGKWVTGFAESCHAYLKAYVVHINFLRSHSNTFAGALQNPNESAYANMQRMTKEYLQKKQWKELEDVYIKNSLPITGFNYSGASDLKETPLWQLSSGIIIGLVFAIIILLAAFFIPNPTPTQFFFLRGFFAISMAAIAAILPGFLSVESRFQKLSIRATGALAVMIIFWMVNPPSLVAG